MPFQTLPRSADRYSREQRAEIAAAVAAVRRIWRQMSDDLDASWLRVGPALTAVATTAQQRVATGALEYVPDVLAETGQSAATYATPNASALVGVAGDGRPVESLMYGGVVQARTALAGGSSVPQSLQLASRWLTMSTGTLLSDTGRGAEKVAMGARKVSGYVRMLVPPSCSRCAILAGSTYRMNDGFQRHPRCDCRHVPSSESVAGDMSVDTRAYFESLSKADQDRIFTEAGAEAIRNGADPARVVNARRHMVTAQSGRLARQNVYGRDLYVTRTGVRFGEARTVRLMPESIAEIAGGDPEEYLRLLRVHGYVI